MGGGSGHGFRYLGLLFSSEVTTRHDSLAFSAFQKTVMLTWSYSTIHKLISDRHEKKDTQKKILNYICE